MSPTDGNFVMITSVTINGCILLYCICLKLRSYLAGKNLCGQSKDNICIRVCKAYADDPHSIAKICVEQLVLLILVLLSITALVVSGVLLSPFRGEIQNLKKDFVVAILSIYIGKYIFAIARNVFVFEKSDVSRFRIDMIHHVTTSICYIVFVARGENLLLALVGMQMELNMTVIELARVKKKLNQSNSTSYKRLTAVSCAVTITFRGVVPIVFLVLCMFQETPFVMSYSSLTMFFVSLIFFSVINVWLILMSLQRLSKLSNKSFPNSNDKRDQYARTCTRVVNTNGMVFEKNNLGYLPRYDNRNLSNKEDEKLNYTRKEFMKEQLCPQFELQINQFSNEDLMNNTRPPFSASTTQSSLSDLEANSQNVSINVIIDNRASTNSNESDSSESAMLSLRQDNVLFQSFRRSMSNETDQINRQTNNVSPFMTSTVPRAASLPDLDGHSNVLSRDENSESRSNLNLHIKQNENLTVVTPGDACEKSEDIQRCEMDSNLEFLNSSQYQCLAMRSCTSFKELSSSISPSEPKNDSE